MLNSNSYKISEQDEDRADVAEGDSESIQSRRLLRDPEGIVKDGLEEANDSHSEGIVTKIL